MTHHGGIKILVTGSSGLIGSHVVRALTQQTQYQKVTVLGLARSRTPDNSGLQDHFEVDLRDELLLRHLVKSVRPDIIIHAAGDARVDYAELHPEEARDSIVRVTASLAAVAQETAARLVFVSSNAVFGSEPSPYSSNSSYSPINTYGRLKVEAEVSVLETSSANKVIRPVLTYGLSETSARMTLVERWLGQIHRRESILALTDSLNQPLYAVDCGLAIASLAMAPGRAHNISGPVTISIFHMARLLAHSCGLDESLVLPIDMQSLNLPATRSSKVEFTRETWSLIPSVTPRSPQMGMTQIGDLYRGQITPNHNQSA